MADILLAVVDFLAEIFRFVISQRYLLLLAGLVWWFFYSIQKSLEDEEKRRTAEQSLRTSNSSETSDEAKATIVLKPGIKSDSLDFKLDSSHASGPYLMPLSSEVATDSEPCESPVISSSTFLKLRATFENAAKQNNATSLPCLTIPRFNQNHSALSHSNTIHNPTSRLPCYDNPCSDRNDLRSYDNIRRPLSPRSLGNSPAVSPREERRSRNSKRLSVCGKCRTAGKSTSWSEADSQLRGRVKRTPDRDPSPATTVFYCGRYISVSNGKQVQIGDHCNMNIAATNTEEYEDGSATDGESIPDHLDLDSPVVTDSEQDDPFVSHLEDVINSDNGCCTSEEETEDNEPLVCSFCRAKMTDDEKSELLPVGNAPRPVRSLTCPLGIATTDEDDVLGAHLLGQSRSVSVSVDGSTPPITDEEKEKLYREAKAKIYEATRRHRACSTSPNFEREDSERKSLRNLTFWKKRKHSTDGRTKAS